MKNMIKLILTFLGIIIFIFCIIEQIDGIGRFACILFGTVFSILGSFICQKRK